VHSDYVLHLENMQNPYVSSLVIISARRFFSIANMTTEHSQIVINSKIPNSLRALQQGEVVASCAVCHQARADRVRVETCGRSMTARTRSPMPDINNIIHKIHLAELHKIYGGDCCA
jgi:hypothetical protein